MVDGLVADGVPAERAPGLARMIIASLEGAVAVSRAERSLEPLDEVSAELVTLVQSARSSDRPYRIRPAAHRPGNLGGTRVWCRSQAGPGPRMSATVERSAETPRQPAKSEESFVSPPMTGQVSAPTWRRSSDPASTTAAPSSSSC